MEHFEYVDGATEEKQRSVNPWSVVGWLFAILAVYVLSSGPAMLLPGKYALAPYYYKIYGPVEELYARTILRKPIGIYWHLWNPYLYDANGDFILHIVPD